MSLTSTNATNSGRSNYTNTNNNLVGVGVASFSSSNTPFSAATTTSASNRLQYCNMIATNSSPTSANPTPSPPSASMHNHAHHLHNHLPHTNMGANLSTNQPAVNAPNGISTTAIAVASSSIQFDPTSSSLSTSSTNMSVFGNTNQAIGLQPTATQSQVLPNQTITISNNNNNNSNANNSNINNHVSMQHSHQYHHHHSTQHLQHNHQANSQAMTSFSNSSTQSTQVLVSTPLSNSNSPVNSSSQIGRAHV